MRFQRPSKHSVLLFVLLTPLTIIAAIILVLHFRQPRVEDKARRVNELLRRQHLAMLSYAGQSAINHPVSRSNWSFFRHVLFDPPQTFKRAEDIEDLSGSILLSSSEDIDVVSNLPRLRKLSASLEFPGFTFAFLETLPQLEVLLLASPAPVPAPSLEPIGRLPRLRKLSIELHGPLNLHELQGAQNLQELNLWLAQSTSLESLLKFPKLRVLHVHNYGPPLHLEPIRRLHALQKLWLKDTNLTSTLVLRNLTKLEELTLRERRLSDLSGLEHLTNLKVLSITDAPGVTDLAPLQTLHRLERIFLRSVQAADVSVLASLTNLQNIGIVACPNVKDISALKRLPNLQRVHVVNSGTTDVRTLSELN